MKFTPLPLSGAFLIEIERHGDNRGFFARTFCAEEFAAHGLATTWVQCNMSYSATIGTVRGLHFQRSPMAETKLVRCTKGSVFDVIVDLRHGSETYGRWHSERLDDSTHKMIYVPEGFAHGFQTLGADVELLYFHSTAYDADYEGGLRWNDQNIGISWPLPAACMSERDRNFPGLNNLEPITL